MGLRRAGRADGEVAGPLAILVCIPCSLHWVKQAPQQGLSTWRLMNARSNVLLSDVCRCCLYASAEEELAVC